MPPRRSLRALAGAAALTALVSPVAAGNFGAGSSGLEDPYFPYGGNGGYDVQHYSLILEVDPSDDVLHGTAIITAICDAGSRSVLPGLAFHSGQADVVVMPRRPVTGTLPY
jgi:hypothetical protein